jgi:hypothetical protein
MESTINCAVLLRWSLPASNRTRAQREFEEKNLPAVSGGAPQREEEWGGKMGKIWGKGEEVKRARLMITKKKLGIYKNPPSFVKYHSAPSAPSLLPQGSQ